MNVDPVDALELEGDLLAGRYYQSRFPDFMEVYARNDDGSIECSVGAAVLQEDRVVALVPARFPVDEVLLGLGVDGPPADRVRFLTELVRRFGYLVGFCRARGRADGDVVGVLGQLVGALADAVRSYRESSCGQANDSGDDGIPFEQGDDSSSVASDGGTSGDTPTVEAGPDGPRRVDSSPPGAVGGPIVIHVYGGMDRDEVARAIQRLLGKRRRRPDDGDGDAQGVSTR